MTHRNQQIVSVPVRVVAGIVGAFLVILAIQAPGLQQGGAAAGLVIGFLGFLLLIPALKAGTVKGASNRDAVGKKFRASRILMWSCLAAGAVGSYLSSRGHESGAASDIRFAVLFMIIWLAGFGFAGLAAFYLEQAKRLADTDNHDAA